MTESASDGHIDKLVKARWLSIGLSQRDLAEILDAAFEGPATAKRAPDCAEVDRLMDIAGALNISAERLSERLGDRTVARPEAETTSADRSGSMHSLLDLRFLRAFFLLRDKRAKLMFVHLAEQIVKRQANRAKDA
jgi:hypothetical protein